MAADGASDLVFDPLNVVTVRARSNTGPHGNQQDILHTNGQTRTEAPVQEHGPGQVCGVSQDGSDPNTLISPVYYFLLDTARAAVRRSNTLQSFSKGVQS